MAATFVGVGIAIGVLLSENQIIVITGGDSTTSSSEFGSRTAEGVTDSTTERTTTTASTTDAPTSTTTGATLNSSTSTTVRTTTTAGPVSVALLSLDWVDETNATTGTIQMDGSNYGETVLLKNFCGGIDSHCSLRPADSSVSYNLSRDWDFLTVELGMSDLEATAEIQVEFVGDGNTLHTEVVQFGTLNVLEIDVGGVLRLDITTTTLDGWKTYVGLGNAQLLKN